MSHARVAGAPGQLSGAGQGRRRGQPRPHLQARAL